VQIGSATVDITPPAGAQLSGYLYRVQPSLGVHDALRARALYVVSGAERLLWLHADLIGLPAELVERVRAWGARRFGLEPRQIVLSATHTHAGPATVELTLCGDYDAAYVEHLRGKLQRSAELAAANRRWAALLVTEGHSGLAIDRRKAASAHTDPRLGVLAWRGADGEWCALLANYAMHNVGLSFHNRLVSADIAGAAASRLTADLPGRPTVLFTAGAAGNTNPPASGTDFAQVDAWGAGLAAAVESALARAEPAGDLVTSARARFGVPLEALDAERIHTLSRDIAAGVVDDGTYEHRRYHQAVDLWREKMLDLSGRNDLPRSLDVELQLVRFRQVDLLCVNAEMFSRFADDLRAATGRRTYVVGYANGVSGYIPPAEAYDEGGYETGSAFVFYGGIRPARGAYEQIVARAVELIQTERLEIS
jgi:hypothetical protein